MRSLRGKAQDNTKTLLILLPLLGTVIGAGIGILGQYWVQSRGFHFEERRLIMNDFPKLYERLAECRNDFDKRVYKLVDFVDCREFNGLSQEHLEAAARSLRLAVDECNNAILGMNIFLSLVGVESGDQLSNMQQRISFIEQTVTNPISKLKEYKENDHVLMLEIVGPMANFNEDWTTSVQKIFDKTKRIGRTL